MPYNISRLEKGIYFIEYLEEISFAEFHESNAMFTAYAKEDGVPRYVVIMDAGGLRKYPTDVRALQGTLPNDMAGIMLMKAPKFGEIIARIISSVRKSIKIEPVKTQEEGLRKARTLLEEIVSQNG